MLPVIIGLGLVSLLLKCSKNTYVEVDGRLYNAKDDEDGDGVMNIKDRCMFVKGPASDFGCPAAYERLMDGRNHEPELPDGGPSERVAEHMPEAERIKENSISKPEEAKRLESELYKERAPEKPNSCINGNAPATKIWTRQVGSPAGGYDYPDDVANGVATDKDGNVYVTGFTNGNLDGNKNAGGSDIFLMKYDPSGNRLWTRQIGTWSYDKARGVATDKDGNVYITGFTGGNLDGNRNAGDGDIFLMKYDPSGTKLYTRLFGGRGDEAKGVATDKDGNVYITGFTYGSIDGGQSVGGRDIFLMKCDSSGNRLWARPVGDRGDNEAHGVATDKDGNVYVTGYTSGSIFLIKYDSSGNRLWARPVGTWSYDKVSGVATDKDGNVYVTAGYEGGGLIFLIKYDSSGNRPWAREFGTWQYDKARGVATDKDGNVYITGFTGGVLDGKNAGYLDIFLIKYDSSGVRLWTGQFGDRGNDEANGVATDKSGNIYVTGYTSGGLDGNKSAGGQDIFLSKFKCD